MKSLVCLISAMLLAGCLRPVQKGQFPEIHELDGKWFSGHAISDTDFVLEDCSYAPAGTFSCAVLDQGCGSFCEAQTFSFSGTWQIVGRNIVRRTPPGSWVPSELTFTTNSVGPGIIYFSDGTRWFRKRSARNKYVVPPNAPPAVGGVDHGATG